MIRILLVLIFSITSLAVRAEKVDSYTVYVPKDVFIVACDVHREKYDLNALLQVSCFCHAKNTVLDSGLIHLYAEMAGTRGYSLKINYVKSNTDHMYIERD